MSARPKDPAITLATQYTDTDTTPEQQAKARRYVAGAALDADDARMLLAALGLEEGR